MKLLHLLCCALGAIGLASRADAQVLYGSTGGGGAGELYILNPANGAIVQDIGPLNDAVGTNYGITGLAFNPVTGVLYGSVTNNIVATRAQLVTINPATAQVTVIGPFNAGNTGSRPATMADLAFDAAGNLFGIGSVGGPNLYTVNTATGQATLVGASGTPGTAGGGLAFSLQGVLFASPQSTVAAGAEFGTYNTTTGAYTHIANINPEPAGAGTGFAAMAFLGNVLYADDLGSTPHLTTIDTTNGTVTDLGTSVVNLDAIAFGPAAVPEPGTMALLFGPVVVGMVKAARRRKSAAN